LELLTQQRPSCYPARSFTACVEEDGSAWLISRRSFELMAAQDPGSWGLLQTIILRSTMLSAVHALEALEHSTHAN
jgi:SulP family sulfate permease